METGDEKIWERSKQRDLPWRVISVCMRRTAFRCGEEGITDSSKVDRF